MDYIEAKVDVEMINDILQFLAVNGKKIYTVDEVQEKMKIFRKNVELAFGELLWYELVSYEFDDDTNKRYKITHLGTRVAARNEGFATVHRAMKLKEQSETEKVSLELKKLNHEVHFQKLQFFIVLVGSFAGFISFLILVYQFLTGNIYLKVAP